MHVLGACCKAAGWGLSCRAWCQEQQTVHSMPLGRSKSSRIMMQI
jgi:hypothetical protein